MKKIFIIAVIILVAKISSAQVSIYGGISDVRSFEFNYSCPVLGLSIDNFYIDVVGNLKRGISQFINNYNVFGGNLGYKLYLTKKLKIIPSIGVLSYRKIMIDPNTKNIYYSLANHRTNWGVTFQRSLNRKFELAIGFSSVEKIKCSLVYNLKVESIYK